MTSRDRTIAPVIAENNLHLNGVKDKEHAQQQSATEISDLSNRITGRFLNLSNRRIDDYKLHELCEMLQDNDTVQVLDLSHNEFNDIGAHDIAEMLKVNNTITKLNLNHNWIRDDGFEAIRKAVKLNHSLKDLIIDEHLASEEVMEKIDRYLWRNIRESAEV